VGISEFALREVGKSGGYQRFTNLLQDPLIKFDAGDIDARTFGEMLEAKGPTGVRWQKGFKNPENVLYGVLERHVDVTRSAIAGRGDTLAKESQLVSKMTRYLRQGHNIKGWNIDFDMTVMSRVAARSSPAVRDRWTRALNMARNRGQVEDMATGAKKFMYLAAQESMMQGKGTGREFFTLGQVDKKLVDLVKAGKLSADEIDKLSWDKIMEPHKGFKEFFQRRMDRKGTSSLSFERYETWLRRKQSYINRPEAFATGSKYPNIRTVKGWSADILLKTLAPDGIKGSTLEKKAMALAGRAGMVSHEGLSDTAYEEILDKIFRVKSKTWSGTWKEMAPRLREYGINTQEEFFQRHRSAIEWKSKSQLKEHALESTRRVDDRWHRALTSRVAAGRSSADDIARAARSQPETLKKIYSRAGTELVDRWQTFRRSSPRIALAAQIAAAAAITDYVMPDRERPTKGIRDPGDAPYVNINGITFGPGRGVTKALTDFGSGRRLFNPQTTGFEEIARQRSKLWIKYPEKYGIDKDTHERNYELWTSARSAGKRDLFSREDYTTVHSSMAKTRGLRRDAWVGIMDLKPYNVKVEDADTLTLERKGVMGWFRKPVSIRMAGIDAPEIQHGGRQSKLVQNQFAGRESSEYLEQLIERQQSLRLVVDPRSRSYNRHVGVLIGDRNANLNLQMVRSGAAASLPMKNKRDITDANVFNEAEAKAAAGGVGMWASKGWQMNRALGIIAGQRVTHTTFTNAKRMAKSNALMAWYGLVQNAHDDKSRWAPQDMPRMYQVGAAYRAETMGAINEHRAMVGPLPGLRRPVNQWQIAGHGINPSSMRGGNVSDFGSGRSVFNAEQLARLPKGDSPIAVALRRGGMSMGEYQNLVAGSPYRRDIANLFMSTFKVGFEDPIPWANVEKLQKSLLAREGRFGLSRVVEGGLIAGMDPVVGWTALASKLGTTEGTALASDIEAMVKGLDPRVGEGHWKSINQLTNRVRELAKGDISHEALINVMEAGRKGSSSDLVNMLRHVKDLRKAYDGNELIQMANQAEAASKAATPPALVEKTKDVANAQLEGQAVQRQQVTHQTKSRTPHEPLKPKKNVSVKRPDAQPVPKAIKEASEEVVEEVKDFATTPATSNRARKVLTSGRGGYGAALGVAAVAATGLAIGTWAVLRGRTESDAGTMAGLGMAPGEFVSMKSHPPFYSSSKAAAWAEHRAMGNPSQMAQQEPSKAMKMLRVAPWFLNPFKELSDSPAMKAWEHFYSGKAGYSMTNQAEQNLYKALKKQKFSEEAIEAWFRKTKATEGFGVKLQQTDLGKSAIDKLWDRWDAVKKWPGRLMDMMNQKKSVLGKSFSNRIKDWFSNLNTKFSAKMHGVDADTLHRLTKAGRLAELGSKKQVWGWARQKDNFKYLWKSLYKDAGSFGAKVDGARQIFGNLGNLEKMRMSIQAGLLKEAPAAVIRQRNLFYNVGDRLNKYVRRSKWFSGKFPERAKNIKKVGLKLKMFSASKAGRVLGKVPYVNMAFGIIEGIEAMDQYENATKGFMVEAAAGTAGSVVETAIMGSVVAAAKVGGGIGFGIGEAIFPLGGGIPGAIIGGAIAVVGTLAVGLIAGQITRAGVRGAGRLALGARMKRTIDPAAYQGPDTLFPAQGFQAMRGSEPRTFTKFHGLDPARPDLVPFGGAYNPIQGQDIDTRTLQIANNRRRVTSKPQARRPISQFTPTFGLVNNVLWNKRRGSKIRSVVERGATQQRLPRQHRNASRMMSHAA
jgi:endonuclease YncB( thermonuclease family)